MRACSKIFSSIHPFEKRGFLLPILTIYLLNLSTAFAQVQFKSIDYIPVSNGTKFLDYPWAGGLNSAQFCDPDLNNDGKRDLIVFEKTENRFLTFIATEDGEYLFQREYIPHLPPVQGWVITKDFNCDGIDDLFTYNNGSIMVYRGVYHQDTLQFELWTDGIYYQGFGIPVNIYSSFVDRPAIADFDFDGDVDILTFSVSANRILLYKNMQKENRLDCDSLQFILKDNCWGNVYESGLSPIIEMRDTCDYKFNNGRLKQRHAGSTLEAFDIRNRGVLDVLMGDASLTLVNHLKNDGDRQYASILAQDTSFPSYNIPARLHSFPLVTFIDVNHDGKKDLIVTPFEGLGVDNHQNVLLYENKGNDTLKLAFSTSSFMIGEMINAGENSVPTAIDVNGDGLKDLIVSGTFRKSEIQKHTLLYFKNTGTTEYPVFQLEDENFLNFSSTAQTAPHPHAGDLDGDGKTDLLIGTGDGRILFYKNTHAGNGFSSNAPTFLKHLNNDLDIGQNAAPFVIDIDQDGKKDLFIGEYNGNINWYKNVASLGQVQLDLQTDSVGKISTRTEFLPFGYSSLTIADVNSDGKLDAIIGGFDNYLQIVYNIQDSLTQKVTSTPLFPDATTIGRKITPSFQHFTKNQDGTLLIGLQTGGVRWWSINPPEYRPVFVKNEQISSKIQIYPNPFQELIHLNIQNGNHTLNWYMVDMLGKTVSSGKTTNTTTIPTKKLVSGSYILYIVQDREIIHRQILIKSTP